MTPSIAEDHVAEPENPETNAPAGDPEPTTGESPPAADASESASEPTPTEGGADPASATPAKKKVHERVLAKKKVTERLAGRDEIEGAVARGKLVRFGLPLIVLVLALLALYPTLRHQMLLYLARSGDPSVRLEAAEELIDQKPPDPEMFDIFVEALGFRGHKHETFFAVVRDFIIAEPGKFVPQVLAMSRSEVVEQRRGATLAIYATRREPAVSGHADILAALEARLANDADFHCRLYPVLALEELGRASSLEALAKGCQDRSDVIRRRSAEALTALAKRDAATTDRVVAAILGLLDDEFAAVRVAGLEQIKELAPPSARPKVEDIYRSAEKPAEIAAALAALASYGIDDVRQLALEASKSAEPALRGTAAAILALDTDPESLDRIVILAIDSEASVRDTVRAAFATGEMPDRSGVVRRLLARLAKARDWQDVEWLHRAIEKVAGREGGPVPKGGSIEQATEDLAERWKKLLAAG